MPGLRLRNNVVRRVRELAELTADDECRLLADIDCVVANPLEATRDGDLTHAPIKGLCVVHLPEHVPENLTVRAIDELVECVQPTRLLDLPRSERSERYSNHLDAALAHVHEAVDHNSLGAEVARELSQLGDGH